VVDPQKVFLPQLHITLGLMKQFAKALDKNREYFKYLHDKFPSLSEEKLKEGIFVDPQIRKLILDEQFIRTMNNVEKSSWIALTDVINNFFEKPQGTQLQGYCK
jgi:hypothetical protein